MRRRYSFAFAMVAALALFMASCGGDDNSTSTATAGSSGGQASPSTGGVRPAQSGSAPSPTRGASPTSAAPPTPKPKIPSAADQTDGNAPGIPELHGTIQADGALRYIDEVVGTGPSPAAGHHVQVHYTGWLTNGTKFDSSRDRGQPFDFVIGRQNVIEGWDVGVATMKVGGKRRLIIPPEMGYGARGAGSSIPPNATLIFDVELLSVGP
jgi:peptidylprolyl isomerase